HARWGSVFSARFNRDFITVLSESDHVAALDALRMAGETGRPTNDVAERVKVAWDELNNLASRLQREIEIQNRCSCLNHGLLAERFAGENSDRNSSLGRLSRRNLCSRNLLIMGANHFALLGRVTQSCPPSHLPPLPSKSW